MLRKLSLIAAAATLATSGLAAAADLPSKKSVPAPAAEEPSAVHGYVDFTSASTRVTGGGLLLYPHGSVFQTEAGVSFDLYKSKTGAVNSLTAFAGVWSESWSSPSAGARHWQEVDWWAGASVGFADHFKLSAQNLEFHFPGGGTIKNATVTLSYDDAHLGLPIALNPYVNVFYNYGGLSAMPMGKTGTYRVDLGVNPGYSFKKSMGVPLSISVPTWIALAEKDFSYVDKAANRICGPGSNLTCSTSTASLFSTGLQAKYALDQVMPKKFGAWYVKGGVQYYHLMSDAVIASQIKVGAYPTFPAAKSDIFVVSGGLGVNF